MLAASGVRQRQAQQLQVAAVVVPVARVVLGVQVERQLVHWAVAVVVALTIGLLAAMLLLPLAALVVDQAEQVVRPLLT